MAKVDLKNVKKNKNNKNTKNNNNKNNQKTATELAKENEIKQKQKEANLINQAKQAIAELDSEIEKTFKFNKSKKDAIKQKVDSINNMIEEKRFDELEIWINNYKELKEEERKLKEEEQREKERNTTTKLPFKQRMAKFFKTARIPIYSRIKNVLKNEVGQTKTLKLLAIFGIIALCLIVFIIGILMLVGIIPFSIGIGNGADAIIPAVMIAISIGVLYFV